MKLMQFTEEEIKDVVSASLSMEGKSLLQEAESGESGLNLYVLLTDTGSRFQRVAKHITKDPYNHVSLALDEDLDEIYTFSLYTEQNGFNGGFMRETKEELDGSKYSLYRVAVDHESHTKVKDYLRGMVSSSANTTYSLKSLVNAMFQKEIFKDARETSMICSEFVSYVLDLAGIKLFKNKKLSLIKPYDFVKLKLLKFVRRGKIRP